MGFLSWLKELFGGWDAPPSDGDDGALDLDAPARRVATHEVSGELVIHEYHHALFSTTGPIAVRTFMTEGIAALNAREVRATVPADWDKDAVDVAGWMLAMLHGFAADGKPATLGGFTAFETSGLAGGALVGVTYARGTPIPGIPGAELALVAVLLHADELKVVQQGLATRVLGLLAKWARFFPYPPCWELRATAVFGPSDQTTSFLEKLPQASLGDVRVTVEESSPQTTVFLSLPAKAAERVRKTWSDASIRVLALLATLAPDADGQAVWVPGSTERTATTCGSAPRRIGYTFLSLVGGTDEHSSELRYIEDGVGLILTNTAVDQLREALMAGRDLTLQVGDRSRLVVEFRPDALTDPFTGHVHHAAEGWELHRPDAPTSPTGPMKIDQIVLLLPEEDLRSHVDAPTLAAFIQSIQQILERLAKLHPVPAPVQLAIGLTLSPETPPKVQLAVRGAHAREAALLPPLHAELNVLPPVAVRGEVPFRIEATVRPLN